VPHMPMVFEWSFPLLLNLHNFFVKSYSFLVNSNSD
jgi:hypothetical protein